MALKGDAPHSSASQYCQIEGEPCGGGTGDAVPFGLASVATIAGVALLRQLLK